MDYLYDLQTEVGNHGDVHIISGYRSPKTNNKLRQGSTRAVVILGAHEFFESWFYRQKICTD